MLINVEKLKLIKLRKNLSVDKFEGNIVYVIVFIGGLGIIIKNVI